MMVMKQMNLRTMEKVCVDAPEQTLSYCWQPEETHLQRAHRHTDPQCILVKVFFLLQMNCTNTGTMIC